MAPERWHGGCWRSRLIPLQGHSLSSVKCLKWWPRDSQSSRLGKKLSSSRKGDSGEPSAKSVSLQSLQRLCKKSYIKTHKTPNQKTNNKIKQTQSQPDHHNTKTKRETGSTDTSKPYHTWTIWQLTSRRALVWWTREEQRMVFALTSTGTVTVFQSTFSELSEI